MRTPGKLTSWFHRQYRWPITALFFKHKWGEWQDKETESAWPDGTHKYARHFLRRECLYTGCSGWQMSKIQNMFNQPREWQDHEITCGRDFCRECWGCLACEPGCSNCQDT